MRLEGRVVIVPGGARGLGLTYARRLASEGARVAIADINGALATSVASDIDALAIQTDVADSASVQAMVSTTLEKFGRVDVLVNNAALFGPLEYQPIEDISVDVWDRVMAVNVRGVFLCCQAVAPHMKRQGSGKIINIASGTLLSAPANFVHYITSKGAVFAMTRALARELGPSGITVNTLSPGLTLTDAVGLHHAPEHIERSRLSRPLARDEMPRDLEGALVFLAAGDSDFMTGQMLVVNGGAQFW